MGEWAFLQTVQRFIDPVAILFAMTVTFILRRALFRKEPIKGFIRPGTFASRMFPVVPIFLATAFVVAMGYKISPKEFLISKGIVSGAMAGFFHRTWKVSVRGE